MNDDSVSWMSPTVPLRSTAITGSAGRYMSIERGVKADNSAKRASRSGVSVGRVMVVVMGLCGPCYKRAMTLPDMTEAQIRRYARHIVLAEIGGVGQAQLIASRVLVIGAGGLGAPALQYLAAAGIGTLGGIDDDPVDLSNLQRQIIHRTADIGTAKVQSAQRALADINPEVRVVMHPRRLTEENAEQIIAGYHVVADGSDNFATRYLVNDVCYRLKKTL